MTADERRTQMAMRMAELAKQALDERDELVDVCQRLFPTLPTLWGDEVVGGILTITVDADALGDLLAYLAKL